MRGLSQEVQMVQQLLRSYCDAHIWPRVDELEEGSLLPYELMRDMADRFGLRELFMASKGARQDDDQGAPAGASAGLLGPGVDPMMSHVIMMELSRASPGLALSLGASVGLTAGTIMARGTREQRERWAKPLMRLERIGAWGLTEPNAGSDAFGSMQTVARRDGDSWVISGQKTYITNAPYADLCVIYARQRSEPGEPVGAFVVEAPSPGLTLGRPMKKMGMNDSPTGEIFLDHVRVDAQHLLGGRGDGASRDQAKRTLNQERSAMPAMAAGMVERAWEIAIQYARDREQFGRPIGQLQAVQLRLGRIHMIRETIWSWLLRLAEAERQGQLTPTLASTAKLYCGQSCVEATLEAIQLLGGFGYMREGRVEKLMRDAKLLQIGGGTDDIQLMRIAHELLK